MWGLPTSHSVHMHFTIPSLLFCFPNCTRSLFFPLSLHHFAFISPFFLLPFLQEKIGMRGLWKAVFPKIFWGHPGACPHGVEWVVWPSTRPVDYFQCLLAGAHTDLNPEVSIMNSALSGQDPGTVTTWPPFSMAFQF